MSELKATPGPWIVCFSLLNGVNAGFHIAASPHGSTRPLAECRPAWGEVEAQTVTLTANAHLISAAPDLYEALRLLLTDVQDYEAWQRPCHAADIAIAALKKARGEPS